MNRHDRLSLHKKQERLQVKDGVPSISELKEGVPVLRSTTDGVVEFVKIKNKLHKKGFTPIGRISDVEVSHSITDSAGDLSAANETELEGFYDDLGKKINEILVVLRKHNLINQ